MPKLVFDSRAKVNPHNHTNRSDGDYSVYALSKLYKAKGYCGLGITDHRVYFDNPFEDSDLILLSGCEFNCYLDSDKYGRVQFHLLSLKVQDLPNSIPHDDENYSGLFFKSLTQVQDLIDDIRSRGNLVYIAHPKWPLIPLEIMESLDFDGFEVYNYKANSDATDYMGPLFRKGKRFGILASDDAHWLHDPDGYEMFYKGYIVLESTDGLVDQLINRRYYASNGPIIESLEWSKEKVETVSNADKVAVICYTREDQVLVKGNCVQIPHDTLAFRVECITGDKKAWTNIIELE